MTRKKRRRKWRLRPFAGRINLEESYRHDENEPPQHFAGSRRRASFSAHVHASGLRRPSAAFPRGILSLRQPGADDPAPRGCRLRSLLRSPAAGAGGCLGRCCRAALGASVPAQTLTGTHRTLSGLCALGSHALPHEPHAQRTRSPGHDERAREPFRSEPALR